LLKKVMNNTAIAISSINFIIFFLFIIPSFMTFIDIDFQLHIYSTVFYNLVLILYLEFINIFV
ncbi:MAG: hypothetical protein KC414_05880, partial [Romboutsia sp.]|nr:hypothetical protein [Romboutsia sp.]